MMSIYTGALLSATSAPLWLVPYRWLPAVFGTSAMATGTAAATLGVAALGAPAATLEPLERIGFAASAAELALTAVIDRRWGEGGVKAPVEHGVVGAAYKVGVLSVGIALPLALHGFQIATGRRSRSLAIAAAVATLAGGFAQRAVLVFGGSASAKRPEDYFTITQPGEAHRWAPA
jgi:formate-dependent nitrite reductase membrane component NrfD